MAISAYIRGSDIHSLWGQVNLKKFDLTLEIKTRNLVALANLSWQISWTSCPMFDAWEILLSCLFQFPEEWDVSGSVLPVFYFLLIERTLEIYYSFIVCLLEFCNLGSGCRQAAFITG